MPLPELMMIYCKLEPYERYSVTLEANAIKKLHLKMSSAKRRPFCLGLSMLSHIFEVLEDTRSLTRFQLASVPIYRQDCGWSVALLLT